MQSLTQVAAQLLRENQSIVEDLLLQPPCITSKSAHSPVALKTPAQKGPACSASPNPPKSESR